MNFSQRMIMLRNLDKRGFSQYWLVLIQQLNHPNIIRYLGSFENDGSLIIVLELAAAADLSRLILSCQRSGRLLSEKTIWHFFVQISSALQHIHSKRIVYQG